MAVAEVQRAPEEAETTLKDAVTPLPSPLTSNLNGRKTDSLFTSNKIWLAGSPSLKILEG